MLNEQAKRLECNAHKYFWIYVTVFFVLIIGMIVITSMGQEKVKLEKQLIAEKLTEEQELSKGIQANAQSISEQNSSLKEENQTLKEKTQTLQQELQRLQKENHAFAQNMELLQKLKEAYVAGDVPTCKALIKDVKEELIPKEELEQYTIIKTDLQNK